MAEEDIVVRLYAVDENFRQTLDRAGLSTNKFDRYLRRNFLTLDKQGTVMNTLTGQTQSYGQTMHRSVMMGRRFQFGWLSIMFAGMALDRVFGSVIKKQFELWGISKMQSSMWTVVMIPAMETLSDRIFALQEAIMDLPEPIQETIGWSVLFVGALGKILVVGGQLMLLLGGLKILAPTAFAKLSTSILGILPIMAGVIASIGAFIALSYVAYKAYKEGFGGIIQIVKFVHTWLGGLSQPVWMFSVIAVSAMGLVARNFEKFKGILIDVWNWIKKITSAILPLGGMIGGIRGGIGLVGFQAGGLVTETGPAFLHAGERVVPKGRVSQGMIVAPTINIAATVSNDMDIRILADRLNRYLADNFERQIIGRGSI